MDKTNKIWELLGVDTRVENPQIIETSKTAYDTYILHKMRLQLNNLEVVPAYLALPKERNFPIPLVLYNHSHGGNFDLGKSEMIQSSHYLQPKSFAKEITDMGYACASIDMWGFEERKTKPESHLVKESLLYGKTVWGMRLFDNLAFIDCLLDMRIFDSTRVATIGMSMGGLMSWWTAALSDKIKVSVDIAGQVDYESLIESSGLDGHGFYYYIPSFLNYFTTADIQKMIVPKERLSIVGKNDKQCPKSGVIKLSTALTKEYKKHEVAQNFVSAIVEGGHEETSEARKLWVDFLKKKL